MSEKEVSADIGYSNNDLFIKYIRRQCTKTHRIEKPVQEACLVQFMEDGNMVSYKVELSFERVGEETTSNHQFPTFYMVPKAKRMNSIATSSLSKSSSLPGLSIGQFSKTDDSTASSCSEEDDMRMLKTKRVRRKSFSKSLFKRVSKKVSLVELVEALPDYGIEDDVWSFKYDAVSFLPHCGSSHLFRDSTREIVNISVVNQGFNIDEGKVYRYVSL